MSGHSGEKPSRGAAEVEIARSPATHLEGTRQAPFNSNEIPLDLDDPHRAAIEDNPERAEKLTWTTLLAVIVSFRPTPFPPQRCFYTFLVRNSSLTLTSLQSLSFSYVCPISCGFTLVTGILVPVGTDLGDTENISWIVGGWSIASSVSFSIAGSLSDIFGRRYTIVSGEILAIVGSVSDVESCIP